MTSAGKRADGPLGPYLGARGPFAVRSGQSADILKYEDDELGLFRGIGFLDADSFRRRRSPTCRGIGLMDSGNLP
jgi:hypothetical protein